MKTVEIFDQLKKEKFISNYSLTNYRFKEIVMYCMKNA
jgi:hypothetical protein